MVVADPTQVENDVVFVIERTANLLPHFETLKKFYIDQALEDFNSGPLVEPYGFGGEYGSNQYCLVLYGTAASAPDAAAHCVIHTSDAFKFNSFLETLRFDGGCGEEHSLLAEGLSLAMQVFDDLKTTRKPQSAPVKRSCIVIANSPPYNIPSRECLNNSYNTTSDQLAEMMAVNGINLSIIAPRKIPALQKIFEKSRREENVHSLSKDYNKDPKHMVCVQGFLLPAKSSPVPKESPPVAMDTTSAVATQPKQEPPITTSGGSPGRASSTGSPVNRPAGKKKNGRPSPSLGQPPATTASLPPGPFPVPSSTPPNVVLPPVVTPKALGGASNSQVHQVAQVRPAVANHAAKVAVRQVQEEIQRQRKTKMMPVVPPGGQLERSGNWSGTAAAIPGAQPPSQGPIPPIEPAAPNPASQQRALAWTGHLEWQDTIRSDPNSPQRITRSLACHVSVAPGDVLKTDKWPSKLIMQLIPQNLLSSLGPLLQSSKTVAFHFAANDPDSLKALYRVMASTGVKFAGCVHFPPAHQCEVKVLLLIFSPRKKAFVGLIPHDQGSFVIGIRSVVAGHRNAQLKKFQQAQAQAQAAQAQASQVQVPQPQAVAQAQAAQAQAQAAQAQAQAQTAQLQHRNLLLHQLQQQQQQQQSQAPGFVPTTATQFAQSQGVQPPSAGPGLPGVSNPINLSSAGANILAGSQNQGIEGMVSSSQSSITSNLGIPAATAVGSSMSGGVTTSLQSMAMDQSDGLRPPQPMYQQSNLEKQKQLQLLAQAQAQARQQQQQQQLQQQLQQQQLQQKAQHQAQQQAQNAQQAQQAKALAQAQQVQAQAQAQAAQAQAQSLRHLLQQNQGSAPTAQQWQLQRQQQQLMMLRQQQAAQQMNQQQINPAQMSQVQAQMTQAQMVQSQAQMTQGQATQSQMMQQQLSQSQSLFPEDVTLIDLLQPQQQ